MGNGASSHNSAGLDDDGCCMPAAMVPRAAVADRNLSCSRAVAKVLVEVAEIGRNLHCMEVVGLGLGYIRVSSSSWQINVSIIGILTA